MYIRRGQPRPQVILSKKYCISLKINLVLANSSDPDEMPHSAAFYLGLHCLHKYRFRGFQSIKGFKVPYPISVQKINIAKMYTLCSISSGSSLFAKVLIKEFVLNASNKAQLCLGIMLKLLLLIY